MGRDYSDWFHGVDNFEQDCRDTMDAYVAEWKSWQEDEDEDEEGETE